VENRKIIIWTKGIDHLLDRRGILGGITVQMYFWAKTFEENDWIVYSFSNRGKKTVENINFLWFPEVRYIGIFIEVFFSLFYIVFYRPSIIILRGASRSLGYLQFFARLFHSKLIFFCASDSDTEVGKELINAKHDKIMFRLGLRNVQYFIVQNLLQKQRLKENYKKINSLIIPNIWRFPKSKFVDSEQSFILWVGNFRTLKRPEWFLQLAKNIPQSNFKMVGGIIDENCYQKCYEESKMISNLEFLGPLPFEDVNSLFASSEIFVCTSEIEGFPNTFLQAWANNKPVVTTFDPSDLIKNNNLGIVVKNETELLNAVLLLLNNEQMNRKIQNNIYRYFSENHNAKEKFNSLLNFINS